MSRPLSPEDAAAIAGAAGLALTPPEAARIAAGISPGLKAFGAVAGTLPLDLEPATFLIIQRPAAADAETPE